MSPVATSPAVEPLTVRELTRDETGFASRLHAAALPHGLFSSLGVGFLARYYASFVESPHAVGLLALLHGRPSGVLVGTVANREHYRWVLRHRAPSLAGCAIPALAVRPRVAAYAVRTRTGHYARAVSRLAVDQLRDGAEPGEPAASRGTGAVGVLTHVCVVDHARGRGVGRSLVDAFVSTARRQGSRELVLVTLAGEAGAGGFYVRQGWSHRGDQRNWDGQEVAVYGLGLR